jgi:hypothetical protein
VPFAPAFEQLDLTARCTHEAQLSVRQLGIAKHERVQLMERRALSDRLHDHEPARVAQPAPAALAIEKRDQPQALLLILPTLLGACGVQVIGTHARRVTNAPCRRRAP